MDIRKPLQFDRDEGNRSKNREKHNVSLLECEELFFNDPFHFPDSKHSAKEQRFIALSETKESRFLIICFTFREKRIRVISARDQHKSERQKYLIMKKERISSLQSK